MTTSKNKIEKELKSADICRIIDSCKKAGVSYLRLGSLVIRFGPDDTLSDDWTKFQKKNSRSPKSTPAKGLESVKTTPRLTEEQLEQLNLEDPESYEAFMINGGDTEDAEA